MLTAMFSALVLGVLVSVPSVSWALTQAGGVQVTIGSGAAQNVSLFQATAPATVDGVRTTTLLVNDFTDQTTGYRITCANPTSTGLCNTATRKWKVIARQSANVTKITVSNARIIAPATSLTQLGPRVRITVVTGTTAACNQASGVTTGSATCTPSGTALQDFAVVSAGAARTAGVVMTGNFTGIDPIVGPAGDRISVTGIVQATGTTDGQNFINQTPGPGDTDTQVSLPSGCTGDPACAFSATAGATSFFDEITETIQINCGTTSCRPKMTLHVDARFRNARDRVDLPNSVGFTLAEDTPSYIAESGAASFKAFKAALQIDKPSRFAFESLITLDDGTSGLVTVGGKLQKAVCLALGSSYSTLIPPDSFRLKKPGLWEFSGEVNGVDLVASIAKLNSAGTRFGVLIAGRGATVNDISGPLPVQLCIGEERGGGQVTPLFF